MWGSQPLIFHVGISPSCRPVRLYDRCGCQGGGMGGFDIWAARWYWSYYNVIYVYNIDQQQRIGYYITTRHYYIETLYIYIYVVSETTHLMIYAYDVHHFCSSKPTMK